MIVSPEGFEPSTVPLKERDALDRLALNKLFDIFSGLACFNSSLSSVGLSF